VQPYYADDDVRVFHGDCRDVLAQLDDGSVAAVVTDPPYGLADLPAATVQQAVSAWTNGDRDHTPGGQGFVGSDWDSFVPPPAAWDQCLRVLKPGGHLLAFAGSRTEDLMMLGVRLAGFEIRDVIQWIYSNGFPKGRDVARAVDQAGGASPQQQARILRQARERAGLSPEQVAEAIGCSVTSVRNWEDGRVRSKGKPPEYIVPGPKFRDRLADLLGYTRDERVIVGGGSQSGGGSLFLRNRRGVQYSDARSDSANTWKGWNTALKPAREPIIVARKPLVGTVADTVLAYGTGALNVSACRGGRGRWPTNLVFSHLPDCVDGGPCRDTCPVAELDRQDDGTSKFFPAFRYEAKAPPGERPRVNGVAHSTVKPLALMRWLVRLVTPPGGLVLDPFAGSGTTLEAAVIEGFRAVGIEREADYLPLIKARLSRPLQPTLSFDGEAG
jgi:DNA modification methylase/transcriptional regulator with XRE-family HTH domain